jgi:DNA-binding response OmpR family regulator
MPLRDIKASLEAQAFRILLIEDNDGDAELVAEYIKELGVDEFNLERASTLGHGLSKLASSEYDIVLLDLHLPDSNGIETLTAICEICQDDSPLVVVLTGMDDQEMTRAALEDCASDFLIKGEITPKSLLRTLRMAVQRHGLRQVAEIQAQQPVASEGKTGAQKILRRANRIAAVAHGSDDTVVGDLTTASHATEVIFNELSHKLDTILESQRRMRGDIADLTIQGRRTEKANVTRDMNMQKFRSSLIAFKKQARPVFEAFSGDKKTPGIIARVEAIEQRDRGWRQQSERRAKTVREIATSMAPSILTAIGTFILTAIGWYITQNPIKK